MSDYCAIFFINTPGIYNLQKGDSDLHDNDSSGIQYTQAPAVAGAVEQGGFDLIEENAGPGMSVNKFLPKGSLAWESIRASLQPSEQSKLLQSDNDGQCLKVREKRLAATLWKYEGDHYKGSHFPVCAFTGNIGRRSPQALKRRMYRNNQVAAARLEQQQRQP